MKQLRIDPVATAHMHLRAAESEMDARIASMAALGHEQWPGADFAVTIDNAAQALRDPACRALAARIGRLGRKPAVGLTLRFEKTPSLADCGGDLELRAYIADGSRMHPEVARVDDALAARLRQIVEDSSWSVPLRQAAQVAAAGCPDHSIAPVSLDDEHIRAALMGNLRWRMVQPGSVDMVVDDGVIL